MPLERGIADEAIVNAVNDLEDAVAALTARVEALETPASPPPGE